MTACVNCKYFHKADPHEAAGDCRWQAPNIVLPGRHPISGQPQLTFMVPKVRPDFWCGQYSPKLVGSEGGSIS